MCLITDIQRYCIHDGDGIRTTVFFKGCPLRCIWCHNPETQIKTQELLVTTGKCTGCGRCAAACPEKAVSVQDGKAVTDRTKCTACGTCTDSCLLNLREIAGKEYTVGDLVKELKKDEMFFEESGGGVTLSGGEVLASDMDFVEELARRLKDIGINVTVDTCGYVPEEHFRRILPYTDTFLYDVKAADSELHRKYTGVDNRLILDNLEMLSREGARIYIRIPVVREVNGNAEEMGRILDFLQKKQIRAVQVNLLPYHNTGASKYTRLETSYQGEDFHAPDDGEMEALAGIFRDAGYQVKIGG